MPYKAAEMESPIDVVGLHAVGHAFDIEDGLVEFDPVGEDVIGGREIRAVRGAEIETAFEPAVDFDPAVFPSLAVRRRRRGPAMSGGTLVSGTPMSGEPP